jgi:hypothetical protein
MESYHVKPLEKVQSMEQLMTCAVVFNHQMGFKKMNNSHKNFQFS